MVCHFALGAEEGAASCHSNAYQSLLRLWIAPVAQVSRAGLYRWRKPATKMADPDQTSLHLIPFWDKVPVVFLPSTPPVGPGTNHKGKQPNHGSPQIGVDSSLRWRAPDNSLS